MRLIILTILIAIAGVLPAVGGGVESLQFGGYFMLDYTWWGDVDSDVDVETENGTEVRRAAIFAKGDVYEFAKFKLEFDLAQGDADLRDAYLEFVKVPGVGNVKVGHYRQPFMLDMLTSSRYITFAERAASVVFAPAWDTGIMLHSTAADGRVTWAVGGFEVVDQYAAGADESVGNSVTARVTGLAVGEDGGERLLHLGADFLYGAPDDGTVRYHARPEVHLSNRLIDTGDIPADRAVQWNLELAGVLGPVHFQGEYTGSNVTAPPDSLPSDPSFSGWYAQVGWFITGEVRAYKEGAWARTEPKAWFREGGAGAFEVAVRYSSLNLNDKDAGIEGGRTDDVSFALNWYIHPNARLKFDYIRASVKDVDDSEIGTGNAYVGRVQFDF